MQIRAELNHSPHPQFHARVEIVRPPDESGPWEQIWEQILEEVITYLPEWLAGWVELILQLFR